MNYNRFVWALMGASVADCQIDCQLADRLANWRSSLCHFALETLQCEVVRAKKWRSIDILIN